MIESIFGSSKVPMQLLDEVRLEESTDVAAGAKRPSPAPFTTTA
jgi:hypothetical protein